MYGNEFETKENKNSTQGKIEQATYTCMGQPEFAGYYYPRSTNL